MTAMKHRLRRSLFWRIDQAEDWLLDRPWWERIPEWVFEGQRVACRLLREHNAIADHCGKPEHDRCVWCGTGMPGQAR